MHSELQSESLLLADFLRGSSRKSARRRDSELQSESLLLAENLSVKDTQIENLSVFYAGILDLRHSRAKKVRKASDQESQFIHNAMSCGRQEAPMDSMNIHI